MDNLVQQILDWGRKTGRTDARDSERQFDAEALRKWLRQQYTEGVTGLFGSWRQGYELTLGTEAIGVTNGYGRFTVYYRKRG